MKKFYTIFIILTMGMVISTVTGITIITNEKSVTKDTVVSAKIVTSQFESNLHKQFEFSSVPIDTIIYLTAGTLSSVLTNKDKASVTGLQLIGTIDARDFKCMRDSMPALTEIDMRNVTVYDYTGTQGPAGNETIVYPANTIPQKSFYIRGGGRLDSINLPTSIIVIGDSAFSWCESLRTLILPNSVVAIGNYAFTNCGLTGSLIIPNSVNTIGNYAFYGCFVLSDITLPNTVTYIGEYAFAICKGLKGNLTIPNSITTINEGAFERCWHLTGIIIPNSVTYIGDRAFDDCEELKELTVSNSVIYIGNRAFADCFSLNGITIPGSVTYIGEEAFSTCLDCLGFSSIVAYAKIPLDLTNLEVFHGVDKNRCTLYVPAGSKTLYQSADQWKDFVNIVEMAPTNVEPLGNGQLNLYPTSVTEGFYIDGIENRTAVTIFNLNGTKLISRLIENKSYINIAEFPAGIYIVKISTSEGLFERKLVKK